MQWVQCGGLLARLQKRMVTIQVVRTPIMNTCLVKTSKHIGGDNKKDLKIMELSICMNFITIALGMGRVIFAMKPPDHLVWKTFC